MILKTYENFILNHNNNMKPSVQKIITKLAKERVELALIDNLMKEYGKLQTLGLEADILDIADKLQKRIPDYKALKNKFNDVEKKAKELGVDKMANDAKEFSSGIDKKIKRIEKQSSLLKSLIKR